MHRIASFLTDPADEELFSTTGRQIVRDFVEKPLEGARTIMLGRSPLVRTLAAQLRELRRRVGPTPLLQVSCIEVQNGDGKSWTSEAVARVLENDHGPRENIYRLNARAAHPLPAVAALLGPGFVLRAAERHRLVERHYTARSPRTWALLGTLVMGTAFAGVLTKRIDDRQPGQDSTGLMLMAVGMAVATVGTGVVGQRLVLTGDREPAEALAGRLHGQAPPQRFFKELAAQLANGPFPRYVVVDDFEELDLTTQLTLRAYFHDHASDRRGAEFWVVVEGPDGARLSTEALRPATHAEEAGPPRLPEGFRVFRQSLLTDPEREQLARMVGDESLAEFQVVRDICRAPTRVDERVARLLEEVRVRHPATAGPGALELFYLIALGQGVGRGEVRRGELAALVCADVRSERGATMGQLLEPFTGRQPLSQHRLRTLLDELPAEFRSLLQVQGKGGQARYRVGAATLEVLEEYADQLQLPDPGVGRLFWALIGHNRMAGVSNDAALVRAQATLCRDADPLRPDPELQNAGLHLAFLDALEATVRACIPVCLFREARRVYDRLRDHAADSRLLERPGTRARLTRLGWELYSLLGDDELLAALLDLVAHSPARQRVGEARAEPLLALAVDAIAIPEQRRRQLLEAAAARGDDGRLGSPAVADFFRARATWIALMVSRVVPESGSTAHARALRDDDGPLELFGRAAHRMRRELDRPEGQVQMLDAATASLSLWCAARQLGDVGFWAALAQSPPADDGAGGDPGSPDAQLHAVLEAARDAVELASRLWHPTWEAASGGPDFVANGFAGELSAMALAAALAAYHALRSWFGGWEPTPEALDAVRALSTRVQAVVGYTLPPFADANELADAGPAVAADSALRLSGIVWRHFGMADWSDVLVMRRLEFAVRVIRDAEQREGRLNELFSAMAPSLQRGGFHGVASNLVATAASEGTDEVKAAYAREAAAVALDSALGDAVRTDLCMVAFTVSHPYKEPLDACVAQLLRGPVGERPLDAWLDSVDDGSLEVAYLRVLNVGDELKGESATASLDHALEARTRQVATPAVRVRLEQMQELSTIERRSDRGEPVDLVAAARQWQERGVDSWMYMTLLERALRAHSDPPLLAEAMRLVACDSDEDRINSRFLLALRLGDLSRSNPPPPEVDRAVLVAYLREAMKEWEPSSNVVTNLRGYRLLHAFDGEHSYEEKIALWERKKIARDHLVFFKKWAKGGQYFLIFREYVQSMEFWGLPLWPDRLERLNAPPESKALAVGALAIGGRVPEPFVQWADAPAVSADFVVLGSYLMQDSPHAENPALAPLRAEFNRAAERELPALVEMVLELPRLPRRMRDLLRSYTERDEAHAEVAPALAQVA